MGDAMSIRRLMIDPGNRSVGTSEFAGGSGALDASLGLEVLAILAEGAVLNSQGAK